MKKMKLLNLFCKYAEGHKIEQITDNDLLGFPYDKEFIDAVVSKYNSEIVKDILGYGDLRIGLILKRIDEELYNFWMEQYSKKYSPLGYYEFFDEPLEKKYGSTFDKLAAKIKSDF